MTAETVLRGEKILITGATGKIAYPLARALAPHNDVWGVARLRDTADRDKVTAAGVTPLPLDLGTGDFSGLPDDFTYVFHAAVDPGQGEWRRALETNAHNSGELLHQCRTAKGFVLCSTGSLYGYQGRRPLTEDDPPGVPLRANYSFSKVAAEAHTPLWPDVTHMHEVLGQDESAVARGIPEDGCRAPPGAHTLRQAHGELTDA